jgi:hypothetical protein
MYGSDVYGALAFGEMDSETYYPPVSRIMVGGSIQAPRELAVLGVDLLWDSDDEMIWDTSDNIGTEA